MWAYRQGYVGLQTETNPCIRIYKLTTECQIRKYDHTQVHMQENRGGSGSKEHSLLMCTNPLCCFSHFLQLFKVQGVILIDQFYHCLALRGGGDSH